MKKEQAGKKQLKKKKHIKEKWEQITQWPAMGVGFLFRIDLICLQ